MSAIKPRKTGDTWMFELGPIKRKGAVVDLSGASIVATITNALDQSDPGVAQVTTSITTSGFASVDIPTGVIEVRFEKLVTAVAKGTYWIDVKVTESDGTRTTFGPTSFGVTQD